jgi:hypothetical protein
MIGNPNDKISYYQFQFLGFQKFSGGEPNWCRVGPTAHMFFLPARPVQEDARDPLDTRSPALDDYWLMQSCLASLPAILEGRPS